MEFSILFNWKIYWAQGSNNKSFNWQQLLQVCGNIIKKFLLKLLLIKKTKIPILSEEEISTLIEIKEALHPIVIASNSLCKSKTNLTSASRVIQFINSKLSSLRSRFAQTLLKNFNARMDQRLNKESSRMANFLNKSSSSINSPECISSLEKIYNRLFSIQSEEQSAKESIQSLENLEDELSNLIDGTKNNKEADLKKILEFYSENTLSDQRIEQLKATINSIQPTSVNPERTFSMSGWICNKVRNRMSSELLSAITFLKYNFEIEWKVRKLFF